MDPKLWEGGWEVGMFKLYYLRELIWKRTRITRLMTNPAADKTIRIDSPELPQNLTIDQL